MKYLTDHLSVKPGRIKNAGSDLLSLSVELVSRCWTWVIFVYLTSYWLSTQLQQFHRCLCGQWSSTQCLNDLKYKSMEGYWHCDLFSILSWWRMGVIFPRWIQHVRSKTYAHTYLNISRDGFWHTRALNIFTKTIVPALLQENKPEIGKAYYLIRELPTCLYAVRSLFDFLKTKRIQGAEKCVIQSEKDKARVRQSKMMLFAVSWGCINWRKMKRIHQDLSTQGALMWLWQEISECFR